MPRISPPRVLLSVMLLAGLSWIWMDRLDELAYFFNTQELRHLGQASQIQDLPNIPEDTFVEVEGTLGADVQILKGVRTGSFRIGPIEIRRLLGSAIFVEYDQEKYKNALVPLEPVRLVGRLVGFDDRSELKRESAFLKSKLKSEFPAQARLLVVDEAPFSDWRYPIFFLLSLLALLASFWSALRRPNS